MSFIVERRSGRGVTRNEIAGNVLRIGRGPNEHVRSDSPSMSMEHARIERSDDGYVISDSGSVTGTYVDGRPVDRAPIQKGSVVELGDLRIEIAGDDPLLLSVSQRTAAMPQQRIDFAAAYRLHRRTFAIAIVVIATLILVARVVEPSNQRALMPGSLSQAHARIDRCAACHVPWHGTSDAKCSACHAVSPHSAAGAPSCAVCHAEHRGAVSLTAMSDDRCTTCHSNIPAFGDHHPEFKFAASNTHLNFSHAFHLAQDLKCSSCHGEGPEPAPIRFDSACSSCHQLDVQHGIPIEAVYGILIAKKSSMAAAQQLVDSQCATCHEISGKGMEATIVTPVVDSHAFAHARFDHTQHRTIACESCHDKARASDKASDVLMPSRAKCEQCHGGKNPSSCVSCHDYHHKPAK